MRIIQQTINHIRYASSNTTIVLIAFLLTAFGAAAIGIHSYSSNSDAQAMVRDCDDNAIVRCGTANYGELTAAYDANQNGDVRAIFDHYWIKRTVAPGDVVLDGWSKADGTVVANGRVVAKNAASIGRQAINHSQPISINGKTYYQTSHVGGQAFKNPNGQLETLVVLDAQGNFKYAVVKACGNPIYATPVPPPAPQPKDIQVCDLASKKVITIKENEFDSKEHSKNLDDCKEVKIQVCELTTKKIITIDEDKFDSNKHSKNLDVCKSEKIQVCDLDTKKIITIDEDKFDSNKHSKDLDDCKSKKIQVCDLESKKVIIIDEDKYDSKKHSKNLADCKPKVEVVEVCDTELNEIVRVSKETAKDSRYSTNLADCETKQIQVCELDTKQVITIDEDKFDTNKHSKNLEDCEETPVTPVTPATPVTPEAPVELPTTGATDTFGAVLGLMSMSLAVHYYALSRRL